MEEGVERDLLEPGPPGNSIHQRHFESLVQIAGDPRLDS